MLVGMVLRVQNTVKFLHSLPYNLPENTHIHTYSTTTTLAHTRKHTHRYRQTRTLTHTRIHTQKNAQTLMNGSEHRLHAPRAGHTRILS